jgi:hypothetical protein
MDHLLTIIVAAWSGLLTIFMSVLGYVMNEKFNKLKDIEDKLNATRIEVAREHITREEVAKITDHIDQRFNKLEEKIDRLIERGLSNA